MASKKDRVRIPLIQVPAFIGKMNSEQPLLVLRMEPVGDLLGDQGGVAARAVVDNEVHLDFDLS